MARIAGLFTLMLGFLGVGQSHAASKFDEPQDQPLFMLMPNDTMEEAARSANGSLAHFRGLLASADDRDGSPMVKIYIADPEGDGMWLWLGVDSVAANGFDAHVFEAPPELTHLSSGSRLFVANDQVADWAIIISGVMHGGYSLRLHRDRLPEAERPAYDRYIGAESYAPLPGL